jgi:hypothetical protein
VNIGGFLDPHIWHTGHVYASESCDPGIVYNCYGSSGTYWPQSTIDDIPVTWTTSPPSPGTPTRYEFGPNWSTPAPSSGNNQYVNNHCNEFYKLTSLGDLPNGTVRAFFNANQVGNSYSGATAAAGSLVLRPITGSTTFNSGDKLTWVCVGT